MENEDSVDIPVMFNNDEMIRLMQLLDLAVKAHGLVVAEHALYFQNKFREAIKKD